MSKDELFAEIIRRIKKYQGERSSTVRGGVFTALVHLIKEHAPELLEDDGEDE